MRKKHASSFHLRFGDCGDRITLRFPAANIYLFDATGSAISVKLLN
jgi:hypothetical protein